jgi:hypothetical protein
MSTPQLPDDAPWPAPPSEPPSAEADFAKMLYQAQIDGVKARYQAQIDEIKARWRDDAANATEDRKLDAAREDSVSSAEGRLREAVHSAYLEVAKGALDRSLQRANFLVAAAGAIATTYTGLLALVYSVSATKPNPLPVWGLFPAFFLGLSLVLGAFYAAFIRARTVQGHFIPTGTGAQIQERRLLFFIEWVMTSVNQRGWALRTSIISLGVGLVLIPLPFLEISSVLAWGAAAIGLLVVGIWWLNDTQSDSSSSTADSPPTSSGGSRDGGDS